MVAYMCISYVGEENIITLFLQFDLPWFQSVTNLMTEMTLMHFVKS